jgi:plasmid stabilization system protein ParE
MAVYKLRYAPEALEELKEVVDYYNNKSNGLGTRFKNNLLVELKAIKARPLSRSFRYDDVRLAVVDKFPYAAHYTVDQAAKIIKIQAILAFAQDDKTNWKKRF